MGATEREEPHALQVRKYRRDSASLFRSVSRDLHIGHMTYSTAHGNKG